VANSNADSVSVIDTTKDQEIERIDVRLAENALLGASPEGVALSGDEKTLYVANAHGNAVAMVSLSEKARGGKTTEKMSEVSKSKILGFIPTGQYPSAIAVAEDKLFVGNGKGTGFESSSMRVNNRGRTPNPPNAAFPPNKEKNRQGGQYSGSIVSGNISMVPLPDGRRWRATHSRPCRMTDLSILRRPNFLRERSPSNTSSTSSRRIAPTIRCLAT